MQQFKMASLENNIEKEERIIKSEEKDNHEHSLQTLPKELLLHICSFLDAKFVIRSLAVVCRYFNALMNDSFFWKTRIVKRLRQKYPAIPVVHTEFNWKEACIAIEEQHRVWSNNAAGMDYFKFNDGLYGAVDCVHLMQNGSILAAGSRDHFLNLLNVDKLDPDHPTSFKEATILSKLEAHNGWIWCMSSHDNILSTGSWDTKIKFWDIAAGGKECQQMSATSALLCSHYEPNCFYAGGYDKRVYRFDPRCPSSAAVTKKYHKQPVLTLVANERFLVTGSEDKTVVVYDLRADKSFKTLKLVDFPMSMWYGQKQLWVGDKLGHIHLFDATDGDFKLVETYDVGHTGKLTGIIQTAGALFTCSTDMSVKVLEPCLTPVTLLANLTQHTADMASISFQNGILAGGSSDCSVGIWKPKRQREDTAAAMEQHEQTQVAEASGNV